MPSLGADMEWGTLLEWRVRPGERLERGAIIALVDTEKAEIEVEVFESGVVEALLVEPGTKVPVGTPLARIRSDAEAVAPPVPTPPRVAPLPPAPPPRPPTPARVAAPPPAAAPRPAALPAAAPPPRAAPAPRIHASPLARRRAAELGLGLEGIEGTGPGGGITREDVERAAARGAPAPAAAPPAAEAPAAGIPDRRAAMRRAIAAAMARAKREIPHYYLATTIDLRPAVAWLEAENARRPVPERLLLAALLLRATALAVHEVPEVNGTFEGGAFRPAEEVHLGVAIALRGGGLVAPAIRSAQAKPVDVLMRELREVVTRARAGVLRSSDVAPATLTVTSLGEQGVEAVFGVIHPPQVALVGFGKVVERPWAVEGLVEARPVVTATLSADHRVSDGHRGAVFLSAIERRLRVPEAL